MRFIRRRAPDPTHARVLEGFAAVAVHVEGAQRSLLAAIPAARDPGVPLAQALAAFAARLAQAEARMSAWHDESVAHEWTMCREALAAARAEAERLRLDPDDLGFEALNARVGDVLHHLETFADVERGLRRR